MESDQAPSGVVTFMFTDIVGSTDLWDAHPRSMADALARHDALLHSAVSRNRGTVLKHTGDGIMASFVSAASVPSGVIASCTPMPGSVTVGS